MSCLVIVELSHSNGDNDALLARGSLEPLANSDIPLVVIIDLLLLKNITKSEIHS